MSNPGRKRTLPRKVKDGKKTEPEQNGEAVDAGLQSVIDAWLDLPDAVKAGMLANVKAAKG